MPRCSGRGIDADTVADEGLTGATDEEVLDHARRDGRMIFTLDRGFGDARHYPPGSHAGIVVFRLTEDSAEVATEAVRRLVDSYQLDDLEGTVTIVQRGTLRIRRLST